MSTQNDFLQDYLFYNSGNMAPIRFHRWAAISVLAMVMGRKLYLDHSYFRVYADSYICLVGAQGIRKSTAKDEARKLLLDAYPNYPIGASVTSREKIAERLSDDSTLRTYTDELGATVEWHPLAFFINELKNFMSINPAGMVEFLTDVYGAKYFDADTIKHGLQPCTNPCINILACETPKWIIDKLKLNIIAGGFSRRMLFVYEVEPPPRITFPTIPPGGHEARDRCVAHLDRLKGFAGPFSWKDQATRDFFDRWFVALPHPEDEILAGFYEAKDILVLKVAMCIGMCATNPEPVITIPLLQIAMAFLLSIEENLPKLTVAAGRNELLQFTHQLLDLLERNDGRIPEKSWHREAIRNMSESEYAATKSALKSTDQIHVLNQSLKGALIELIVSPKRYKQMTDDGELKTRKEKE